MQIDYHALEHAIPTLDAILVAALHDRRVGWSDRAVYRSVCDAVALSGACYATQRIALDLCRDALGIPDSIEDGAHQRRSAPPARRIPENDPGYGVRTVASSQGATAPISREAA